MLPKKKRVPVFLRKVAEKSAPAIAGEGPEDEAEMAAVEEEAADMDEAYDTCTCPKCGHEFDPDEDAPSTPDEA